MAIDATVGGSAANSYVTMEAADDFFDTRINGGDWGAAGETVREAALVTAAHRLDQEAFRGTRSDSDQALAWPRYGVTDADGRTIDSDTIPTDIKRAQMELAFAMIEGDLLADTGLEAVKNVRIGSLDVTPRHRTAGALPAHVQRYLSVYQSGSPMQFRMVRG